MLASSTRSTNRAISRKTDSRCGSATGNGSRLIFIAPSARPFLRAIAWALVQTVVAHPLQRRLELFYRPMWPRCDPCLRLLLLYWRQEPSCSKGSSMKQSAALADRPEFEFRVFSRNDRSISLSSQQQLIGFGTQSISIRSSSEPPGLLARHAPAVLSGSVQVVTCLA